MHHNRDQEVEEDNTKVFDTICVINNFGGEDWLEKRSAVEALSGGHTIGDVVLNGDKHGCDRRRGLKEEAEDKDHGYARDDVRVVGDHELVGQNRRRFRRSGPSLDCHRDSLAVVFS